MEDVDGVRIAYMDRQGIAVQVLSCVSHIPEELPKEEYLSLYRMMNEEVNEPILANAPVCDAEKKKISYLNAEQLLKI